MRLKSRLARKRITIVRVRAFAIALVYTCAFCALDPGAWQASSAWGATAQASSQLSESELSSAISTRIEKVPEFRFIREEAEKMGVKVYLFGGTAAGFGHYVKWDLEREKGDKRFQPDRFDYDYTNIYRSTQDLDIVLDGDEEQAKRLQALLQDKYPHLQGSKTAWEVRLLRKSMGTKEALLDNPDYLNQHTDSNSTGLIELNKPARGESVIRDLRDWKSKPPYFLKDLQEGTLHYYYSPQHHSTARFRSGENPEIFSEIRYLTKAFQYELKIPSEDLKKVREVISNFDPRSDLKTEYAQSWIEKNGKKLMQHAVNLEYASKTLSELGLSKKLIAIQNNPGVPESLAWWLSKEPLKTKPVGEGSGKTAAEIARELGEKNLVVAHETGNFLAYESITRAHTGDPNVLISRAGEVGEAAVYGEGFYTRLGREGARGTGLTIRFTVDPRAREGTDFIRAGEGKDFLIIRNKAAIRVIPESLKVTPLEFFRMLVNGKGMQGADRGILEKLKRRIGNQLQTISPREEKEIYRLVQDNITKPWVMQEWFSLPKSVQHPELVEQLLSAKDHKIDQLIAIHIFSQPQWAAHPELLQKLIDRGTADHELVRHAFSQAHWSGRADLLEKLIERGSSDVPILREVLAKKPWEAHPELVEKMIQKQNGHVDVQVAKLLGHPQWSKYPHLALQLLENGSAYREIADFLVSKPEWAHSPEVVDRLVERGLCDLSLIQRVLDKPFWRKYPGRVEQWLETILRRGASSDVYIDGLINTEPYWSDHPVLVRLCGGKKPRAELLRAALKKGMTLNPGLSHGCGELFGGLADEAP